MRPRWTASVQRRSTPRSNGCSAAAAVRCSTPSASALRAGAVPHHSFTVLCVYPWVGMLDDARRRTQAMIVLDRCRIRWGQVRTVSADKVTAESQSLVWAGGRLAPRSAGRRDGTPGYRRPRVVGADRRGRLGGAALGLGLRRDHRTAAGCAAALQQPAPRTGQRLARPSAEPSGPMMAEARTRLRLTRGRGGSGRRASARSSTRWPGGSDWPARWRTTARAW